MFANLENNFPNLCFVRAILDFIFLKSKNTKSAGCKDSFFFDSLAFFLENIFVIPYLFRTFANEFVLYAFFEERVKQIYRFRVNNQSTHNKIWKRAN